MRGGQSLELFLGRGIPRPLHRQLFLVVRLENRRDDSFAGTADDELSAASRPLLMLVAFLLVHRENALKTVAQSEGLVVLVFVVAHLRHKVQVLSGLSNMRLDLV